VVAEDTFVPHTPDPELNGTRIVYAVRLDDFDKLSKRDQEKLVKLNPHQVNKATPIFYVGQTTLLAWQRYENHRNGYKKGQGWVEKYGQHLIVVDEWEPDFGVVLPKKAVKAAWELARRSKADALEREKAVAELLRAQGYYVISH
jgi:predicted GIY-YIG superfamily endonuclease